MGDIAQIKLQRKLKEKEKREAEFNACLQDISEEALLENIQPTGKIDAEKVRSSVKSLCDYLLHAIEVEQCIYKTEKRMRTLFEDIPMIERSAKDAIEKYGLNAKVDVAKEEELLQRKLDKLLYTTPATLGFSLLPQAKKPSTPKPIPPTEPVYEKPGLFNKKKVIASNIELENKYKEAMVKYKADKEAYELEYAEYIKMQNEVSKKNDEILQRVEARKKELGDEARRECEEHIAIIKKNAGNESSIPEVVIQKIANDEMELAKDAYKKLMIARKSIYLPNIIFIKYRTLPALATIYEYLMSGRCTTLEGPDGAYNLYESEIRANMIITKLDLVIEKLEEIKNAQYMLCQELSKANASLSSIGKKMDDACSFLHSISNNVSSIRDNSEVIKNNTAVIAYNTARTAFYSEMTAAISAAMMFGF